MPMVMNYTDIDLENLLNDIESDMVERKETWKGDAPEKGREAVCAFANDLPDHRKPGILFVGAKNDGTPSGLLITDQLLQTLSDIKTDGQMLPPPTIIVQKKVLKTQEMAVVLVQPAEAPPVRYKGRIWVRIGPRRSIATVQDERILNERRRNRDIPFDIQPVPSATLNDLDRLLFEQEYLPNAFAPDILEANERSYEQRLAACKMISVGNSKPTILGLLAIGKNPREWIPGAYIQFLRINGLELSDPVQDEAAIDGSLGQILRRIDEKLEAHNRTSIDIASGNIEKRTTPYPRVALQQIVRNAVMHRTYEGTNSPVRVYWFNDRIEIINSGGPFGEVTIANFGKPGITDYRNPNLADAMKVLGYVQKFGVGIQTAQSELKKNGNPLVEFTVDHTSVLCTIKEKR